MAGKSIKLIISTMRDEGPYIVEWIAYHRAIGFTDFLIYTNDCRDGTDLLLDRLTQLGIVTHVRNKVLRRGPHKSALKAAQQHSLYKSADWVYVTDVDEFLNIQIDKGHIDDLLKKYKGSDVIPITWRMFSHNEQSDLYNKPCIEAFIDAESAVAVKGEKGRFVKSIFKPNKNIERMGLHAPFFVKEYEQKVKWGASWVNEDASVNPQRPTTDFGYDVAQVNHYAVRSIDAFMIKRDRGRANHVRETIGLEYWKRWSLGGVEDTSIQRHLPAMKKEFFELMEDPVLAGLHEGSLNFQKRHVKELLNQEPFQKLKQDILTISGANEPEARVNVKSSNDNPVTQELQIKAPARHQNRLRMLEHMPKGGRCAEIGVWNGGFSGAILDVTQPSELVLIDPWDLLSAQSEDEWTHKKHKNHIFMSELYLNVEKLYGDLDNVTIRKGFSENVLSSYPDNYFDWVYIDGNHLYEFVKRDIEISFEKIRPGGIIAGDDFFWKKDNRMHVREAVIDTLKERGMQKRPNRLGQQYMITVPE